ncbi:MAG: outer membrane beta-barrel protein [Bacteroidaceae bacterium]|nr:outer membrane beta-barrel protein [Bacteroidaceae bacterium]
MKRIATLLAFLATSATALLAQNLSVKGTVYDFDSAEPLSPAAVQIYQIAGTDSTYIGGTSTDDDGVFVINSLSAGNFVAKVTFLGYDDVYKNFTLRSGSGTTDLGKITMRGGQMLDEVAISAVVAKVQMINDTVMFNSAAYKLPEGSSVEDLIRKLPGVQIGSDGNITVNGKTVSRILVNGKEFFNDDKTVALTQLTADMIEKVKAYEKQSDLARQTGIDDGEEETVLDLQVKKGMAKGWFGNLSVGGGAPLHKENFDKAVLYQVNASLNRFDEDKQFTIMGSASQSSGGMSGMGGMRMGGGVGMGMGGFGMGGGFGGMMGGGGGVNTSFSGGANFAMNLGKEISSDNYQYEVGGSVNWSRSDNTGESKSYTKDFSQKIHTFSNQAGANGSGSESLSAQMRIEWNKDNYTSLLFQPQFSYSTSNSWNANKRYQFVKDPYQYTIDPLDSTKSSSSFYTRDNYPYTDYPDVDPDGTFLDSLYEYYMDALQNIVKSSSTSESKSISASGRAQFVRRFGNRGRNISVNGNYNIQRSETEQLSHTDNLTSSYTNTSVKTTTIQNRYTESNQPSNSYGAQMTYSEPIGTGTYLQFSYQFSYSERNEDRSTYNLADAYKASWGIFDSPFDDIDWNFNKDTVSGDMTRDARQSTKSFNYNYDQNIQLQFRKNATDQTYNFTAGITWMPQYTKQPYNGMGLDTVLERTVNNFTPTVQFRYRITRQEQINIRYNGRSSQPQMSQLLPITDDRQLTRIQKGNPSLVPYYTNQLSIGYQKYNPVSMGSFNVNASVNNTLRSITTKTTIIDDIYGAQMTQPFNLDGFWSNWSSNLSLTTNTTLPDDRFSFTTNTSGSYNHQEGLTSTATSKEEAVAVSDAQVFQNATDPNEHRSNSNSINARENMSFEYRDDYLTVSLDGSLNYQHSENDMTAQIRDTYTFSYGASFMAYIPWRNMRLGSDLNMNSRRGYDGDANTDELIWNASLSFSFLKGNKASLSLAAYDLLHQRSNMNYNVGATSISQTQNKNITSYFMATLTYRLSLMGDRNSRQQLRGRGGMGGGFGGGMGGFGGGMGGFGGGMGGGMPMGGGMGGMF